MIQTYTPNQKGKKVQLYQNARLMYSLLIKYVNRSSHARVKEFNCHQADEKPTRNAVFPATSMAASPALAKRLTQPVTKGIRI